MELVLIHQKIHEIRGSKVMLDFDLAELYQVETKRLKEAVRRNSKRFPIDFMFQIDNKEFTNLRSHIASSSFANHGGTRHLPFAFTEQGVAMLSSVLNSEKAIEVNIAIIRAFVYIRQYALNHLELTDQLKQLEIKYNKQFDDVFEAINYLLKKDSQEKQVKGRTEIGYKHIK
jgi:hypothetical protein